MTLPRARQPGNDVHGSRELHVDAKSDDGDGADCSQEHGDSGIAPHSAIAQECGGDAEDGGDCDQRNRMVVVNTDGIARAEHHGCRRG